MLSVLVHTQSSLRFALPLVVLVGVSPHYFFGWLTLRLATAVLPRKVYEKLDDAAYDSYQSLVSYFFETYAGTEIFFYGDDLPESKKENVIYIGNHQSSVDWVISDLLAIRQGALGSIRYVLKSGLRYLPLYGLYFAQHGCVYVRRGGSNNDTWIKKRLKGFVKNKSALWLVIFPEGTRYNVNKPNVIKASQKFAKENGLPVMDHILTPRTRAVELSVKELSSYVDAVYDVTLAYKDPKRPVLPKEEGPSLTEFLSHGHKEIHVHLQRIEPKDLPQGDAEIKEWVYERFANKDRLLSCFYDEESGGQFPGTPKTIVLRTRRTLPYFIFWGGVLAATLHSKKARWLYLKSWLASGVASIVYMGVFYDWLQA
eukprot:gene4673-5282_t